MSEFPIFNVILDMSEYNTGESVGLSIIFSYTGEPKVVPIKIFNRVTGEQLDSFGLFVLTGERKELHRTILMPEGNLPLSISINGKGINRDVQNISAPTVPIEPEEIIPEEELVEEAEEPIIPVDEPPEIPFAPFEPIEFEVTALPWFVSWLSPLSKFFGAIAEGVTNHLTGMQTPSFNFFTNPVSYLTKGLSSIFKKSVEESIGSTLKTVKDITGNTPDWKLELDDTLKPYAEDLVKKTLDDLSVESIGKSPLTPSQASIAASGIATTVTGLGIGLWLAHGAAEAASLGQYEAIKDLEHMVIAKLGLTALGAKALSIPLNELVFKRSQQFYASLFTPEIPAISSLINMVVKEKISVEEFIVLGKYKGFSERFLQLEWDAHFIAPSLGQLLTSFRRGTIDEVKLDELEILVDLDPIYKDIWLDQRYRDPTPRQARWMFEAGAIDEARVTNIVERSGLLPDDVEPFTEYLLTFNERQWKRRYILEVARGFRLDKVTEDELRKEVLRVYNSVGVANWIVATEIVKKVNDIKELALPKVKLIGLGEWKKGYLLDKVTEDELRAELIERNYETLEIDLLVEILNEDKLVKEEGAKIVRLTKAEMLQAFKQEEIDEDDLRIYLINLGLDGLQIDTLINTKKKQWGMIEE